MRAASIVLLGVVLTVPGLAADPRVITLPKGVAPQAPLACAADSVPRMVVHGEGGRKVLKLLQNEATVDESATKLIGKNDINVQLSPDAKWLVTVGGPPLVYKLTEIESGKASPINVPATANRITFTAASDVAAVEHKAPAKDALVIHDVKTGRVLETPKDVKLVMWLGPEGVLALALSGRGGYGLWDVKAGKVLTTEMVNPVRPALHPQGNLIALVYKDKVKVHKLPSLEVAFEIAAKPPATSVVFTPDGKKLVVTETARHTVYDSASGKELKKLEPPARMSTQPGGVFCGNSRHFHAGVVGNPAPYDPDPKKVLPVFPPAIHVYDLE